MTQALPVDDIGIHDFDAYVDCDPDGVQTLDLLVEGMHCPSCVHQIEQRFRREPDVIEARVNFSARRLTLKWRGAANLAVEYAGHLARLGFSSVPCHAGDGVEATDRVRRRLLLSMAVAGFAAANVMLLSIAVWAGAASDMGPATRSLLHWVSALIALPAIAWSGRVFFSSAIGALRARSLNMDVPISVAIILAAAMSLFETWREGEQIYFDAAVTLLFILLIGRTLDHMVRAKAQSAAHRLTLLGAVAARVIGDDGVARPIAARLLNPGMIVIVAAGERIPADGCITDGASDIDNSLLTGETLPRPVCVGDAVHAGTLNQTQAIRLRVAQAGDDTALAGIVRLMEAAEQNRSRYVRLADRAARFYAPVVHLAALLAFVGWTLIFGLSWQPALMIAVSVLIITCPCALGLAVPAVQVAANSRLFDHGVLVKRGDALERLALVEEVVFDKTGTLTTGTVELANSDDIDPASGLLAAGIASVSRHPLCRALVEAYGPVVAATGVAEFPGQGLEVVIDGKSRRLGSRRWCGIAPESGSGADGIGPEIWMVTDGEPPVRFAFSDRPRVDAAEVVIRLRALGLSVRLMSGDRVEAVRDLAGRVGIEDWQGDCSPAQKAAYLEQAAQGGRRVLMVGDGLNDAPALAGAFVSASPAEAADISRTAADFIFQGEKLMPIAGAVSVARKARRLALQNLLLAAGYNVIAVPLAIAGLVTPLIAAVAMSASSIIVTLNALRARIGGGLER
jgi:Cu2+-exporting ATPase